MAGLMYFIPEPLRHEDVPAALARLGLEYAFPGGGFAYNPITAGPDGASGVMLAPNVEAEGAEPALGFYDPAIQTWQAALRGAYWIGWDNGASPRPIDLQRAEIIVGTEVKLNDGNEWQVPAAIAHFPRRMSRFPAMLALDADGKWITQPQEVYRVINEQADRVWQQVAVNNGFADAADATASDLVDEEAIDIALAALAVNYRIGRVEAAALCLFTTSQTGTVIAVLEAFVGLPQLVAFSKALAEASKKNGRAITPVGSDSSDGVAA